MQFKTSLLVALCASLGLTACGSTVDSQNVGTTARIQGVYTQSDSAVYMQKGMEISSITSRMADSLQQNMFYYLLPDAPIDRSSVNGNVKIVTMPRLAITSFVDTDTYENAGYLGRALAEFFTNEMSNRAFEVTEYKLTGSLAVSTDGDFILSRNWKKIARDTKVKYLLGGTLTRNADGIVVVARIVNMQTRQTIATSTDFIPYDLLPKCYRTAEKNCTFTGTQDYLGAKQIRDAQFYKAKYEEAEARIRALQIPLTARDLERKNATQALTKAQVVSPSGRPLGGVFVTKMQPQVGDLPTEPLVPPSEQPDNAPVNQSAPASKSVPTSFNSPASTSSDNTEPQYAWKDPRFTEGTVQGATSRGNYDRYREQQNGTLGNVFGSPKNPVVYPANTYVHNTLVVRDTADESSYSRVSD